MPKIQSLLENFFMGKQLKKLNKDEAVAFGATVLAAMSSGADVEFHNVLSLDVYPFSIGLNVKGDQIDYVVLSKNTTLPT